MAEMEMEAVTVTVMVMAIERGDEETARITIS